MHPSQDATKKLLYFYKYCINIRHMGIIRIETGRQYCVIFKTMETMIKSSIIAYHSVSANERLQQFGAYHLSVSICSLPSVSRSFSHGQAQWSNSVPWAIHHCYTSTSDYHVRISRHFLTFLTRPDDPPIF